MKVALFDLFETLVTQKHPDGPSAELFAEKLGLELNDVRTWWRGNVRDRMTGRYPTYDAMLSALCSSLGSSIDDTTLEELCEDRQRRKRAYLLGVDSKIMHSLSQLRTSGWTIGIVSNATPDEIAGWRECPLRDVVDDSVFSCEVGSMKPEATIYHLACKRLDVFPPEGFFVGDGGFDELQGAAKVGMRPVQAKWYVSREIDWKDTSELNSIDRIGDLFDELELMSAS